MIRFIFLGRVGILLTQFARHHLEKCSAGVASQSEVCHGAVCESKVDDVLDVAGDETHLGDGAHAQDLDHEWSCID